MKSSKTKEPKMLLFFSTLGGYGCEPHSVVAWLYYNQAPELAEKFALSMTKCAGKIEKRKKEESKGKSEKEIKKLVEKELERGLSGEIRYETIKVEKEKKPWWKFWRSII